MSLLVVPTKLLFTLTTPFKPVYPLTNVTAPALTTLPLFQYGLDTIKLLFGKTLIKVPIKSDC